MDGSVLVMTDSVEEYFSDDFQTLVRPRPSVPKEITTEKNVIPIWIYPILIFLIGIIFILGLLAVYNFTNSGRDDFVSKNDNVITVNNNSESFETPELTPIPTPIETPIKTPIPTPQRTPKDDLVIEDQPRPKVYGKTRIKFARGAISSRVSGEIDSKARRSFLLQARSGQNLSAQVNSTNNCVIFENGSSSLGFTTISGDNQVTIYNNCESANFSLTVSIQ